VGWRVVRSSHAALLERARASYASLPAPARERKTRLDARVFGSAGGPLKLVLATADDSVTVRGEIPLAPASKRALDRQQLREQLGRLGDTPFVLASLDDGGLAPGLFLPVSELNRLRQQAVEELLLHGDWAREAELAERRARVEAAVATVAGAAVAAGGRPVPATAPGSSVALDAAGWLTAGRDGTPFVLSVSVDDARAAAAAGATEIVFDPFLRHPAPPATRVAKLAAELRDAGVLLRLRTPTIVRPEERRALDKWLDLGLPIVSGHLGLVAELARAGRDVVADYAVNCFNQHTAGELYRLGARRVVLSVELTAEEMAAVGAPWGGEGFDVLVYGRPEGMTIEHCVLSAAFDRVPTTCRDLCVQKHTNVELTDPAGYTFPVATDAACRNRLLHSRPIDGSEYLPRLWAAGIRNYRLLFNVRGEPVAGVVAAYRRSLEAIASGADADCGAVRGLIGGAFTRGHFARAV
jgi:putative protease